MASLIAASAVFVGSHFLLSHPARAPLVSRMGRATFMAFYSLVALMSFLWMIYAFRAVPARPPLWMAGDLLWGLATAVMLFASILLAGSFSDNPALPDPRARANVTKPAQGVFAITRHPMMWSFILWGVVHILVMPTAANFVFAGAIIFLAFFGSFAQDRKKVKQMGTSWQGWRGRTAFFPFGMQIAGKAGWDDAMPAPGVLLGGTLIWLGATWAHGGMGAGIWRWL